MRVGDPDGHGRFGMLDEVGGRLVCHECGSAHLGPSHVPHIGKRRCAKSSGELPSNIRNPKRVIFEHAWSAAYADLFAYYA